jgi:hypothetical protein
MIPRTPYWFEECIGGLAETRARIARAEAGVDGRIEYGVLGSKELVAHLRTIERWGA